MAVVGTALELANSPEANFSLTKHRFTRHFLVECSSVADGPVIVTSAIGLPRLGQRYLFGNELHRFARVIDISPKRKAENSPLWEVSVDYETPDPKDGEQKDGQSENPTIELPEVSTSFEDFELPITKFYNIDTEEIQAPKASNGEIYDPPLMRRESRLVLTISRNEDLYSPHPATSILYQNCVNSDRFWSAAPGQVICKGITAARQTKQLANGSVFAYLKVSYTFQFARTWDLEQLDHGNFYKDDMAPDAPKIFFTSVEGFPIKGLLDGAGGKLPDGEDPVYQIYRPYRRLPYRLLNLPNSFLEVK